MSQLVKNLVVGGSIGDVCTDIALRRKGVRVDLVEIKSESTLHGVGITQRCNVMRKMARPGVLGSALQAANAFDDVGIYNADVKPPAGIPGRRLVGLNQPANVGTLRLALHEDRVFFKVATQLLDEKYPPRHTGQSVRHCTSKFFPMIAHQIAFQVADVKALPTTTVPTESTWFDKCSSARVNPSDRVSRAWRAAELV
jgi:hypothetical protein